MPSVVTRRPCSAGSKRAIEPGCARSGRRRLTPAPLARNRPHLGRASPVNFPGIAVNTGGHLTAVINFGHFGENRLSQKGLVAGRRPRG